MLRNLPVLREADSEDSSLNFNHLLQKLNLLRCSRLCALAKARSSNTINVDRKTNIEHCLEADPPEVRLQNVTLGRVVCEWSRLWRHVGTNATTDSAVTRHEKKPKDTFSFVFHFSVSK